MPEFVGNLQERSIVLPIECPDISPDTVEQAYAEGWNMKPEFHVSVMHPRVGKQFTEREFKHYVGSLNDQPIDDPEIIYGNSIYKINRPKYVPLGRSMLRQTMQRESIVATVGSEPIRQALGHAAAATSMFTILEDPLLHVTLFTRGNNEYARRGISLATNNEWYKLKPEPKVFKVGWQKEQVEDELTV